MEKDKKYNVILGLMIFFFILVVGISLAWGLGCLGKNSAESEANNQNNITNSNESVENEKDNSNTDINNEMIEQDEKTENEENKKQESNSEATENMTVELAYGILNKYKAENLPDEKWYITNVSLVAHGDYNSYWVSYDAINYSSETPYDEKAGAIIEYKNGKWEMVIFGFTGLSSGVLSTYNFVEY